MNNYVIPQPGFDAYNPQSPNGLNISAGFPLYSDGTDHHGVDFKANAGTPVYAAVDGSVKVKTDSRG